ncbi:unnamed protein product, partial [Allacma fusca]
MYTAKVKIWELYGTVAHHLHHPSKMKNKDMMEDLLGHAKIHKNFYHPTSDNSGRNKNNLMHVKTDEPNPALPITM